MFIHVCFALEEALGSLDKCTRKLKVNEFPGATVSRTFLRTKVP